jgi:maltose alpha-D-glucosyltransferase/alpha-amylase
MTLPSSPHHPPKKWYQSAVFYQVIVRTYQDGNGDGIGDFIGLTNRLDYIKSLGVDAIWINPFYPSPGRDDGYDVSDFCDVHPDFGTIEDFERFVKEAHLREIYVVIDLVLNHTSDQHEWFKRACKNPHTAEGQFYVWNKDDLKYPGVRVIFDNFETSNWQYNQQAEMYYWHRFFREQPDLNYESPDVHEAMLGVAKFWIDRGVDGFRLDSVCYLYEAEGTECAHLPETHQFLKKLRTYNDTFNRDIMLLAEVTLTSKELIDYLGDGDECHMVYDFQLMRYIYISIERQNIKGIVDSVLRDMQIPNNCQWMTLLRCHDDLSLSRISDEDRQFLFDRLAPQPNMRIKSTGVRRRLAPMCDGNIEKYKAFINLLLFLPGSPVIYYGDEIGMGENLELQDRYPVRTAMQWDDSLHGGFSKKKGLPVLNRSIEKGDFAYPKVNVSKQENDQHSLLNWFKRQVEFRKKFIEIFSDKMIHFIKTSDEGVLAFERQHPTTSQHIIMVQNLRDTKVSVQIPELIGVTSNQKDANFDLEPYENLWYIFEE